MHSDRFGLNALSIAHVAAGVVRESLLKISRYQHVLGHADPVIYARHGREVAADDEEIIRGPLPSADSRARCRRNYGSRSTRSRAGRSPTRASGLSADRGGSSRRRSRWMPWWVSHSSRSHCKLLSKFHSLPLAEVAAHEQQLLAGMRPHVAVEQPQVGELLPQVAGHLVEQRALAVHDFVVRQRQDEVLV